MRRLSHRFQMKSLIIRIILIILMILFHPTVCLSLCLKPIQNRVCAKDIRNPFNRHLWGLVPRF